MPENMYQRSVYYGSKVSIAYVILFALVSPAIVTIAIESIADIDNNAIVAVNIMVFSIIFALALHFNKPAEYIVDPDRLIIKSPFFGRKEIRFSDISAIRTLTTGQAMTTSIFERANDHDALYRSITFNPDVSSSLKDRIKKLLGIPLNRYKIHKISSSINRYPDLISDIMRSSHYAMSDPVTKMITDFSSPGSHMQSAIILSSYPEHNEMETIRGSMNSMDGAKAERILRKLSKSDPDNAEVWKMLGQLKLAEKKSEKAAEYFKKTAEIHPGDQQAHFYQGIAYYCAGEFKEAYEAFKRADDIKRLQGADLSFMGCSALNAGKINDARTIIEPVCNSSGDSAVSNLFRRCAGCTRGDNILPEEQVSAKTKLYSSIIYYTLILAGFVLGFAKAGGAHARFAAYGAGILLPILKYAGAYFKDMDKSPAVESPYACWLETGISSTTRNKANLPKLEGK